MWPIHFHKQFCVALTLWDGTGGLLSWWLDFSIGGVHGVEEQPALIATLQHHGLTAENGGAVPLWSTDMAIVVEPHAPFLCPLGSQNHLQPLPLYRYRTSHDKRSHIVFHVRSGAACIGHKSVLPWKGHLSGSAVWSPVWGLRHSWTSLAEPHNPQNLYASTILLRPPEASPQSGLQLSYKCDSDIHIYIHFNRSCLANSPNGQQLYANDNMQMYLNRGIVRDCAVESSSL